MIVLFFIYTEQNRKQFYFLINVLHIFYTLHFFLLNFFMNQFIFYTISKISFPDCILSGLLQCSYFIQFCKINKILYLLIRKIKLYL